MCGSLGQTPYLDDFKSEHVMQYTKGLKVADPDEVRTIFLVFFTVFEPLRLLAAYHGNLFEKVLPGFKSSVTSLIRRFLKAHYCLHCQDKMLEPATLQ
jgi:hypothetical protein